MLQTITTVDLAACSGILTILALAIVPLLARAPRW